MCSRSFPAGLIAALAIGFVSMSGRGFAADTVPTDKTDWSKFTTVSTITAEVRAVDGDSVTLRVYWMAHGAANTGNNNGTGNQANNNNNNNNKVNTNNNNNNNRRPSLYHSSRNGRSSYNPLQQMISMARSQQSRTQTHQEHHDYDVGYFADTKVTGVKSTDGVPATVASLTPGTVVSAMLVHDKAIALKDMKDSDLRVRSIQSLGHNPNFKDDSGNAKAPAKKK